MRTIKYKGKRLHINEWVSGSLYIRTIDGVMKYYIIENDKRPWRRVDPKTVGQFTGLKDKNWVEIYEGDILKIDEGHPVEVRYEKIYASFGIWRKGWAFLHYFHEAVDPKDCEVIGNIHDKNKQKQALIDMMRGDEEIGLYNEE